MRILYHHRTLGDGAEGIHVREMVAAFRALDNQVEVIGPAGENAPSKSARSKALGRIKRMLPSLAFELLEIGYGFYSLAKTTMTVKRFRPDFIYDRYITFNFGNILAARLCSIPLCLEVNAPLALERSGEQDERLVLKRIAFGLERWICSRADVTLVVSTPLRDYLESVGVPSGACIVMANGVDPVRFSPRVPSGQLRESAAIPPERFVIGFTGVLRPWHGLDLLIRAAKVLVDRGVDAHLLIVGDGPYRPTLEAFIESSGLTSRTTITGLKEHDRVADYVALFDVAVSPRATFYASPMKVIEYMSLGKPVLVPDTANFLDIVVPGESGAIFNNDSAESLCAALEELFRNPANRERIAVGARQRVLERLNWHWNAREACRLVQATRRTQKRH